MRLMTRSLFESIKKSQMRFQVWKLFQVIQSVNLPNAFDPRRKRDSIAQPVLEIPHPYQDAATSVAVHRSPVPDFLKNPVERPYLRVCIRSVHQRRPGLCMHS